MSAPRRPTLPTTSTTPVAQQVSSTMRPMSNLDLATGASGARDLAALLPQKAARDINRYIVEQPWGRKPFVENTDLLDAPGLSITRPLKEKSVAMRLSDMGEVLGKGLTLWGLIDAVVVRGDSVAKCTV